MVSANILAENSKFQLSNSVTILVPGLGQQLPLVNKPDPSHELVIQSLMTHEFSRLFRHSEDTQKPIVVSSTTSGRSVDDGKDTSFHHASQSIVTT